jgi:hypothetical protein
VQMLMYRSRPSAARIFSSVSNECTSSPTCREPVPCAQTRNPPSAQRGRGSCCACVLLVAAVDVKQLHGPTCFTYKQLVSGPPGSRTKV